MHNKKIYDRVDYIRYKNTFYNKNRQIIRKRKKTLLFLHIRDKLLKFAVKFETGMSANIKNMY